MGKKQTCKVVEWTDWMKQFQVVSHFMQSAYNGVVKASSLKVECANQTSSLKELKCIIELIGRAEVGDNAMWVCSYKE